MPYYGWRKTSLGMLKEGEGTVQEDRGRYGGTLCIKRDESQQSK